MPPDALSATAFIAAAGAGLLAAEDLAVQRRFRSAGIMAWRTISLQYRVTAVGPLAEVLRRLFSAEGDLALTIGRLVTSAGLVAAVGLGAPIWPWALGLLILLLLLTVRIPFGLDGAHHMYVIVFGALAVTALGDPTARWCVVVFIALEAQLAYFVSGVAKACSGQWRSGAALPAIMGTKIYGQPDIAGFLESHPRIALLASWAVIGFEIAFPGLVLLGPDTAIAAVGAGALFHAGTAVTMGLNGFLFAFVATYPAVLAFAGVWPGP